MTRISRDMGTLRHMIIVVLLVWCVSCLSYFRLRCSSHFEGLFWHCGVGWVKIEVVALRIFNDAWLGKELLTDLIHCILYLCYIAYHQTIPSTNFNSFIRFTLSGINIVHLCLIWIIWIIFHLPPDYSPHQLLYFHTFKLAYILLNLHTITFQ